MVAGVYQGLLILHVLCAMVWFGGTLGLGREARQAIQLERSYARLRIAEIVRSHRRAAIAALLVLVSGVAIALITPGGFGALGVRYHIALSLTLAWVLLCLGAVRSLLGRLARELDGERPLVEAARMVRRLAGLMGMQHALFGACLVLMLWRL